MSLWHMTRYSNSPVILGDTYAFGVFKGKPPGDLYRLGQVSLGGIECFAGLAQLGIWILSDAR